MSNPVATINGVAVYSDKTIQSVVNNRVTFSDGSWCDVASGSVVNKGGGFITIGSPPGESAASDERTTFGPESYTASALDVRDVPADVEILPTDDPHMTVTVEGSKSVIDDLDIREHDGVLTISGSTQRSAARSVSVSRGTGATIVTGSGNTVFNQAGQTVHGGRRESDTTITVDVPRGSRVNVSGVDGEAIVGNIDGPLTASVQGGSDIRAGEVRDAMLSVQGSGEIHVQEVSGNLTMNVQGSGEIRVWTGYVRLLTINVQGSGDARFDGEAVNAELVVMGSGDINVRSVSNRPVQQKMGKGDIRVGNHG